MFEAHKEAKTFAESFMRLENEDLRKRLAALQSENAEKDKCIARVEAERDRAYRHICDQCDIFPCLEDGCPWSCGAQGEG